MINSVRNTVLSVLNKNNYGYISPSDFNLYAKQAQLEVFEEYFSNYNKAMNMENIRSSGSDYADIAKALSETIENFLVSDFLVPIDTTGYPTNKFYIPTLTTVGNESYMINKVLCYTKQLTSGFNDGVVPFSLIDSSADFIALGIKEGDIVVNASTFQSSFVTAIVAVDELSLYDDIFTILGDDYFIYSPSSVSEVEKVSSGKITLLNNSLITNPNLIYPAYTQSFDFISVFPSSIVNYGAIQAVYFRYPKEPKWTYSTLASGEPVFNQSQPDYQDFEMPQEDEFKLVMKILQYCGVSIRENEVTQFAMAQEQHEQPTFSQQQ